METSNLTTTGPLTEKQAKVVSNDNIEIFVTIVTFGLLPLITLLGIIGNSLTVVTMSKHGLQTSSTVLLFTLAVADVVTLCGTYNVPELVYKFYGDNSFPFSEFTSRVWLLFYLIIRSIRSLGYNLSMFLPMVITIERLVAVFLPLRFSQTVTPVRVAVPLVLVVTFCAIQEIQGSLLVNFVMEYDATFNSTVGKLKFTDYYTQHYTYYIQSTVQLIMLHLFPAIFTAVGCVILSVKIRLVARRRKAMTSSDSAISTSQTTKMMLAVCCVYVCVSFYSFSTGIPQLIGVDLIVDGRWTTLGQMMMVVSNIANCTNSSCNFAIYVLFNKKFRDTLLILLPLPCVSRDHDSRKTRPETRSMAKSIK